MSKNKPLSILPASEIKPLMRDVNRLLSDKDTRIAIAALLTKISSEILSLQPNSGESTEAISSYNQIFTVFFGSNSLYRELDIISPKIRNKLLRSLFHYFSLYNIYIGRPEADDVDSNLKRKILKRKTSSVIIDGFKKSPILKRKRDKPSKRFSYPKYIDSWLAVWKVCGLKPIPAITTKTFTNTVERIKGLKNGTLLDGTAFTLADWETSVSNFHLASTNVNFHPQDKSKIVQTDLRTFILNTYARGGPFSMFLKYLQEPPEPIERSIPDPNPALTHLLRQYFLNYRKDKLKITDRLTLIEDNKIIRGSIRLMNWYARNAKLLPREYKLPYKLAELLWNCLTETVTSMDLSAGFFCSDLTFDRRLPSYTRKKGLMS